MRKLIHRLPLIAALAVTAFMSSACLQFTPVSGGNVDGRCSQDGPLSCKWVNYTKMTAGLNLAMDHCPGGFLTSTQEQCVLNVVWPHINGNVVGENAVLDHSSSYQNFEVCGLIWVLGCDMMIDEEYSIFYGDVQYGAGNFCAAFEVDAAIAWPPGTFRDGSWSYVPVGSWGCV